MKSEVTASIFQLRFRCRGKQVVRYVGNAEQAAAVKRELSVLQAESRVARKLNVIAKIASKMLRDSKTKLKPIFESHGLAFHGLTVRRPRQRTTNVFISTTES